MHDSKADQNHLTATQTSKMLSRLITKPLLFAGPKTARRFSSGVDEKRWSNLDLLVGFCKITVFAVPAYVGYHISADVAKTTIDRKVRTIVQDELKMLKYR